MISEERLINFCRALSDAVRSGLPLNSAFETLAKSRKHGRLIERAAALTSGGAMIHEALAAQGGFPPVFLALLRAGEESGKTVEFLDLYADCLDVRLEFGRRIRRALLYPAVAVLAAAGLFVFFLFVALPAITAPLREAGGGDAGPAWALASAAWLKANWPLALAAAIAALLAGRAALRSALGRKSLSLAGHWLPGFRYALGQGRLSQTYTTIGLLLKAGLPLGTMMEVLIQFAEDDPVDRRRFARAADLFAAGKGFTESMAPLMPEEDAQGLEMAEKAGWLDDTMLRLGKAAQARQLHRLKILTNVFKIGVIASLAPACFLLIFLMLRQVFAALGASGAGGSGGARAPEETVSYQPPPVALPAPSGTDAEAETAAFNKSQGGRIAGLLGAQPAASGSGTQSSLPRLRPISGGARGGSFGGGLNSGGIRPTGVQPTDVTR
jgi:general secretion pathway protein F